MSDDLESEYHNGDENGNLQSRVERALASGDIGILWAGDSARLPPGEQRRKLEALFAQKWREGAERRKAEKAAREAAEREERERRVRAPVVEVEPGRYARSLVDVMTHEPEPVSYLDSTGVLEVGARIVLYGEKSVGKTYLALRLALDAAIRGSFVAFIAAERIDRIPERIKAVWQGLGQPKMPRGMAHRFLWYPGRRWDAEGLSRIVEKFSDEVEHRNADPARALLVTDPLARCCAARVRDDDSLDEWLDGFADWEGTTLTPHHPTKGGDDVRGSGALLNWADVVYRLDAVRNVRRLTCEKNRDGTKAAPRFLRMEIAEDRTAATFAFDVEPPKGRTATARADEGDVRRASTAPARTVEDDVLGLLAAAGIAGLEKEEIRNKRPNLGGRLSQVLARLEESKLVFSRSTGRTWHGKPVLRYFAITPETVAMGRNGAGLRV